jgi:hypothetical protein
MLRLNHTVQLTPHGLKLFSSGSDFRNVALTEKQCSNSRKPIRILHAHPISGSYQFLLWRPVSFIQVTSDQHLQVSTQHRAKRTGIGTKLESVLCSKTTTKGTNVKI